MPKLYSTMVRVKNLHVTGDVCFPHGGRFTEMLERNVRGDGWIFPRLEVLHISSINFEEPWRSDDDQSIMQRFLQLLKARHESRAGPNSLWLRQCSGLAKEDVGQMRKFTRRVVWDECPCSEGH